MSFSFFYIFFFCFFLSFVLISSQHTHSPISSSCIPKKLLWITAIEGTNKDSSSFYYRHLTVAIKSASLNAPSLIPVLLIPCNNPPFLPKHIENNKHITIICHNLTFESSLRNNSIRLFGPYYRLDIPIIFDKIIKHQHIQSQLEAIDLKHVLYTDSDVMFFREMHSCSLPSPKVLLIGPESVKNTMTNSGVLYMNITAMKEHYSSILAMGKQENWKFGAFDQGLILKYFVSSQIAQFLPNEFNWKGYWGGNPNASILHFHGPKPGNCLECYLTYRLHISRCYPGCKGYNYLFNSIPDGGNYYEDLLSIYTNYTRLSHK